MMIKLKSQFFVTFSKKKKKWQPLWSFKISQWIQLHSGGRMLGNWHHWEPGLRAYD